MPRRFLAFLCVFPFLTGCQRSDGEHLVRIGHILNAKVQGLMPSRNLLHGTLPLPATNTLEDRVRIRIKEDRYLATQPIEIHAEGSTIHLIGSVEEDVLRARASELAETTRGVENVVNSLRIE